MLLYQHNNSHNMKYFYICSSDMECVLLDDNLLLDEYFLMII